MNKGFNTNEIVFMEILKEAKNYCKGELELNLFENKWYAMDYIKEFGYSSRIEREPFNNPLITVEEANKNNITIENCCSSCDVFVVY